MNTHSINLIFIRHLRTKIADFGGVDTELIGDAVGTGISGRKGGTYFPILTDVIGVLVSGEGKGNGGAYEGGGIDITNEPNF